MEASPEGAALKGAKEPDERFLIEAAQRDPSRFAELYETHLERVYAFIARRVRTRDEVEDLTSEVFRRALSNLANFEWRGAPFAAWLFRIAANAIRDHSGRLERAPNLPQADDPVEVPPEDPSERARLFRLVETLPRGQRRVIEMRFAEERSIAEIARAMGRTEGAVKQLQFRGLENLRRRMGQRNG
jgi:RNA polymerase sigma-70 factor (ECF subfamily)